MTAIKVTCQTGSIPIDLFVRPQGMGVEPREEERSLGPFCGLLRTVKITCDLIPGSVGGRDRGFNLNGLRMSAERTARNPH